MTVAILSVMLMFVTVLMLVHVSRPQAVSVDGVTVERSDYQANVRAVSRGFAD
jgi:hypothetical protein